MPKNWEIKKIGDVLALEYGKGLPERERLKGTYPVVGSAGIVGYHNKALVKGPGLVIGRKGTIGAISMIESDFWAIDTTYYIKILVKNIDLKWLFYALIKLNLPKLSLSDVVPGLKRELVYSLKFLLPPLPEQKKIAEVLSTVDQVIEKVDAGIKKTQRVKKGLMQELLTKGTGHNEFKDTEIGKIPKEWTIVKLIKIAKVRYGLGQPPELEANGIPMIRATNIKLGKIVNEDLIYVKKSKIPISRNPYLKEGDILIVRSGAYTGDVALIKKKWHGAVAGYDLVISPSDNIDSQFLTYFLLSPLIQNKYFMGLKVRSAQPHLNSSQVEKTPVSLPPLSEQQKIAEILSAVDDRLELLRKRKEKFQRIKKGLMNDLLTGRKRVKLEA